MTDSALTPPVQGRATRLRAFVAAHPDRALLGGVLIVALGLRLWGVTFGLPYLEHPDEPFWIQAVLKMVKTGDPNPHDFVYPSLYYYLNALIYLIYYGLGRLAGSFHGLADLTEPVILIGGSGRLSLPWLVLGGRLLSVIAGCGTVALTWAIARRLTGLVIGAGLAALFVAISPTLVMHDRYMAPDGPMTFFTTLTVLGAWLIYQRGRTRDYALTGIALGLAAGMKYNVALFAVMIGMAHFMRSGWRGFKDWRIYAAGALSVLVFLLTTPYAILDAKTFLDGALIDVRHYGGGHFGVTGNSLAWYVSYLWQVEGPVLALAAAGMLWGVYRRSRGAILVAVMAVVYLLFIGAFAFHVERTALPLIPLIALLAAAFACDLGLRWTGDGAAGLRIPASALIAVALVVPLVATVREAVRVTTPDSLDTARAWIGQNIPAGSRIGLESYSPFVDPQKYSIQGFYKLNDHPPEWYREQGYAYLIFSQRMFRRFYTDPASTGEALRLYEDLFRAFEPVKVFTDGGYEVRIHRVTPEGESTP